MCGGVRACASASQCAGPLPRLVKRSAMKWICRYELRDTGWPLTKNERKKKGKGEKEAKDSKPKTSYFRF